MGLCAYPLHMKNMSFSTLFMFDIDATTTMLANGVNRLLIRGR
jgi:hypothetical protein